ncbi:MAG: hypothetical protein GY820_44170 [Gammaproteobacteria bacterium]|nr:hypothetical protein [Gammaproteobacteria bacterium]
MSVLLIGTFHDDKVGAHDALTNQVGRWKIDQKLTLVFWARGEDGMETGFGENIQITNRRKGLIYMEFIPYSSPLLHRSDGSPFLSVKPLRSANSAMSFSCSLCSLVSSLLWVYLTPYQRRCMVFA